MNLFSPQIVGDWASSALMHGIRDSFGLEITRSEVKAQVDAKNGRSKRVERVRIQLVGNRCFERAEMDSTEGKSRTHV